MIQKGVQPGTDEVYLMNRLMRVHLLLQFLNFFLSLFQDKLALNMCLPNKRSIRHQKSGRSLTDTHRKRANEVSNIP